MATIEVGDKEDFHEVLTAPGRSPEIPESADAYGWLIGSWELDVYHYWGLTSPPAASRAKLISVGCSRAGPCRTSGSCPGVRSVAGSWKRA